MEKLKTDKSWFWVMLTMNLISIFILYLRSSGVQAILFGLSMGPTEPIFIIGVLLLISMIVSIFKWKVSILVFLFSMSFMVLIEHDSRQASTRIFCETLRGNSICGPSFYGEGCTMLIERSGPKNFDIRDCKITTK